MQRNLSECQELNGQLNQCLNILKEAVADTTWVGGQLIHCENLLKEAMVILHG